MKHTPGPWKVHRGFNFLHVDGPDYGVCILSRATSGKVDGRDVNDRESLANAHLIAAASEMLEALICGLVALRDHVEDDDIDVVKMKAAIAKARGES